MKSNISNFEKKLKINIKNKSLFIKALTHKSVHSDINNEKLEFLGDRVIGLVLSKKLFDLYPDEATFQANRGLIYSRNAPYDTDGGNYYLRVETKF